MTAKRFNIEFDGHQYFLVNDEVNERCLARLDTRMDALAWLEMYKMLSEENEQLKQSNQELNDELQETMSYLALKSGIEKENEQLKKELRLKEEEERINCRNCSYFISNPSSDCCLKREDIGYKGTCIDGMDYYYLAKNCPYY